ncbi:excalibur calcium-binding domain-containing protein [Streptococcus porcinus]|uniref:Excalibur domain-containing protein n=2 Tax=Streptococcus porcinus TaxID=1340 RepID=A0A4V0HA48_STRPO|nr:excalibur calcium-binding domain-containing protein [Streptococcus porcinus]EGJ27888.1 excalibur domain protein [Streptococcus porcinus str. Jelinkova 176]SQG45304.1 excalibur domain-containing protein [Streptococcus porcinus]VTT46314.1 excalibur domain-containing protein [Streptococcus porcinus]VTT47456.1 excalibur domain-containing protein [Streptococcus porcinus]
MKNKSCLTAVLYVFLGIIIFSIILILMPLILIAGIISLWFYSKKKPDSKRKNYAIGAIAIGLIGTSILSFSLTHSSNTLKNTEQVAPNTVISSKNKETNPQAKHNSSQSQNKGISKANLAISQLEKDTNPINLEKARVAIKQIKNDKDRQLLQKRFVRLEQDMYTEEAKKITEELELTKTKSLIESARQKVNLITDVSQRKNFTDRINLVNKTIEEETQMAIINNAESAVKQLEVSQIRDHVANVQNKVNLVTDSERRTSLINRINTVISTIELHEIQEREAQATTAPQFSQPPSTSNSYYANCTAMRNANAAPIQQGQPGYSAHLDRDHDGWACE